LIFFFLAFVFDSAYMKFVLLMYIVL
jgi:hypothetical protein